MATLNVFVTGVMFKVLKNTKLYIYLYKSIYIAKLNNPNIYKCCKADKLI